MGCRVVAMSSLMTMTSGPARRPGDGGLAPAGGAKEGAQGGGSGHFMPEAGEGLRG